MTDFIKALKNVIPNVYYCEHVSDNSFVSRSFSDTKNNLKKLEYTPVGVCFEPSYRDALGPALVFQDKNGNTGWVHLGQSIMIEWLTELDMMPPDNIVWDWNVIKEHVWGEKVYE